LSAVIILSVVTTIPLLGSTIASAATKASDKAADTDWQIKSLRYYQFISNCFSGAGKNYNISWNPGTWFSDHIASSSVSSGQWFSNGAGNQPIGVYMKGVLNGVNDAGSLNCGDSSLVSSALSLWGMDAVDVFCHSGFQRVDMGSDQSMDVCKNGKTDFEQKDNVNPDDLFSAYIKDQVYGGKDPSLTDAQLYVLFRHSLNQSCIPGIDGTAPGGDTYGNDNKYGYNDVKWVNVSDESVTTGSYLGSMKTDAKITIGPGEKDASYTGESMTCSAAVSRMSTEQFGYAGVSEDNYTSELTFRLEKDKIKLYATDF